MNTIQKVRVTPNMEKYEKKKSGYAGKKPGNDSGNRRFSQDAKPYGNRGTYGRSAGDRDRNGADADGKGKYRPSNDGANSYRGNKPAGRPFRDDRAPRSESTYAPKRPYGNDARSNFKKPRPVAPARVRPEPNVEDDKEISALSAASEATAPETGIHGDIENGNVIGRSAVRELLKSGRSIDKILVQPGDRKGSITALVAEALERRIPVIETEKAKMDEIAGFAPHQGIIAMAAEKDYCTLEDILAVAAERGEDPVIVLCDDITDPYNLGAIIRCAECCGAHGVVIPKRRAVGLTPLVTKASAGAMEYMAIAKVPSILTAIDELKKKNVWVFAAEAGGQAHYNVNFKGGCAIVMGSEGDGVSHVVKEACDGIVSIPMYGKVNSFNVSTAAAVILAEVARQHHLPKPEEK